MEDESIHRHDISDEFWSKLEPLLPGRKGSWGGQAKDNRRFKRSVLDSANWSAMERSAGIVWRLEEYASQILPLAR